MNEILATLRILSQHWVRLNVMRECKACLAKASKGKAGLALPV